ncbi:MAG: hypothetical protein ACXVP0_05975 [Bacteroidia bacterium]
MSNIEKAALTESTLKSVLSNIPIVGTALSETLFDYKSRVKQERLNIFVYELGKYFKSASETDIDIEFIRSEDFAGLFELVVEKVTKTGSVAKRDLFKKIVTSSIEARSVPEFTETFLSLISQLNEKQIEILNEYQKVFKEDRDIKSKLYELSQEKTKYQEAWEKTPADGIFLNVQIIENQEKSLREENDKFKKVRQPSYFKIEQREFNFFLQDLVSKCLMRDIRGGMGVDDSLEYEITEFGEAFLSFLKA